MKPIQRLNPLHSSKLYSKTVFIPKSDFPPKHDPKSELAIQDGEFSQTYDEQDPARKPYVIHDGPPFANGPIHIGHAINKILKDVAARYAMITGHKVEFITGWDVHGLPIEMQVSRLIEEQQKQGNYGGSLLLDSAISPETFRAKARSYAKTQIDLQLSAFKRIGLLTNWNKRYTTDDPAYVANQLRAFSQLKEKKLVYKDLMPTFWSTMNKTTIADADVDYKSDHISKSAYVLYEIIDPPFTTDMPGEPIYGLIWTTTPWTLLENRAIAFNKDETYCIVKIWNSSPSETVNLLTSRDALHKIEKLVTTLGYEYELKTYIPGKSLVGLTYKPRLDRAKKKDQFHSEPLPFLNAEFVDGAKGTGLVHIAPNYGVDDFDLARKHKLAMDTPLLVDKSGMYVEDAGESLAGKHIFSDGNNEILNILDQEQALFFTEHVQHSYPYEARTNSPVMIRASQQIFIDTKTIVSKCMKLLSSSSFYPENRARFFINTLESNTHWCISRQRIWGTPIPVFYEKDDKERSNMITHPGVVEHLCKLLYKRRFMDYWWTLDNEELIPQKLLDECKLPYKSENLLRGSDIFDVWSDSGLSWHTTTNGLDDSKSQADLYLEGSDQIRGWFSASSLMSVALRNCLPTKRFFLHGFALDEKGFKMSKSRGNSIDPIMLFDKYGVDPVRVWAARSGGQHNDIRVSRADFEGWIDEYIRKVRLTLKYLIGALKDYDALDDELDPTKLSQFDQYYLDNLYRFGSDMDELYKTYRYDEAVERMWHFLNDDLSPIYITTIKDLLYCDDVKSGRRRSALTVLNLTYNILLRSLYPLTPHIVHETGDYIRPAQPLLEWNDLGYKASWKNDVIHDQMGLVIKIRDTVQRLLGTRSGKVRDYDAVLTFEDKKLAKQVSRTINADCDLAAELFKVSTIIICDKKKVSDEVSDQEDIFEGAIEEVKDSNFELKLRKSKNGKCARCRRYSVMTPDEKHDLCQRCRDVLRTTSDETYH